MADEGLIDGKMVVDAVTGCTEKCDCMGWLSSKYQVDVNLAGASPLQTDVTAWAVGDRGIGIGTGSEIYLMYKDGATSVKFVQLT